MKATPLLFTVDMIRALLDGRKTQTRRIVRRTDAGRVKAPRSSRNWHLDDPDAVKACPYGGPGDLIWVRETWGVLYQQFRNDRDEPTWYRASGDLESLPTWYPSIHMPRWRSRLTLELTEVRLQRVQDISEQDAEAEGIECIGGNFSCSPWRDYSKEQRYKFFSAPSASFRSLWDSINAKRGYSWDSNPWVWALTFKVHKVNVDQMKVKEAA